MMAKPIPFTSPPPQTETPADDARAELDELLVNLHERGILRLLNGLLAAGPEVSVIAMGGLTSESGQRAVRNAIAIGAVATRIDPDTLTPLLDGIARGVEAAAESLTREPPSTVSLLKSLRDPAVRRGTGAILALLKALGQSDAAANDGHGD